MSTLIFVRTWVDPYNERGQYRQSESFAKDLHNAKILVDASERGLVLVPQDGRIVSRVAYSKGF